MIRTFSKYWDRFWFSRFDPVSISIFRISLGLLILIMFISNFPNWERFYAADGIFSLNDVDLNLKRNADNGWWSLFWWTEGTLPIRAYWWIGVFSSLAFTVGWQTRLATIILFLLQSAMIHRNPLIVNGDDLVFRTVLFYSCFAPLNFCLSVDSWLKRRRLGKEKFLSETELPLIWPIRAMQINIALIYLISLPNKLVDDGAWLTGDAIYWTITSSMWSRFPWPELFYNYDGLLSKIATYGTILIEGSFPILVWFQKTKLLAVALIAALHLGIAIVIPNVLFFTLGMVCSFWVFVPASSVRQFWKLFHPHLGREPIVELG